MAIKNFNGFFVGLGFVGFSVFSAMATTFVEQPFEVTVGEASNVVKGKILSQEVDWVEAGDGNRRLYTFWELAVEEVLKGKEADGKSQIRIRSVGGEKDGVGMKVIGAAEFEKGEEVVVLLGKQNPDQSFDVNGLMMGKLLIEKSDGEEVLVGPALFASPHEGHDHGATSSQTGGLKKFTVSELRKLIGENHAPKDANSNEKEVTKSSTPPASQKTNDEKILTHEGPLKTPTPESQEVDLWAESWVKWVSGAFLVLGVVWFLFRRSR